jgi:hypothetical protein
MNKVEELGKDEGSPSLYVGLTKRESPTEDDIDALIKAMYGNCPHNR